MSKEAAISSTPEVLETPRRVLVVDDNEHNRDMLTRRLARKGFTATAASDGQEALDLVGAEEFDIVILDVMMPGIDGMEVLARIRDRFTKSQLPVIMATARAETDDVVAALDGGANDYVTKPIDLPVLIARIKSQLATRDEAGGRKSGAASDNAKTKEPLLDISQGIPAGTVIDERYEIQELLGEGGFAAVHRAIQLSTGQVVAFKYARPERAQTKKFESEIARFMREMQLIAKLRHPHIVRLVDSGKLVVARPGPPSRKPAADPTKETRIEHGGADSGTREKTQRERSDTHTKDSPETLVSPGADERLELPYLVMEMLAGEPLSELINREAPLSTEQAVELLLPVLDGLDTAHRQDVVHRDVKPDNIILVERDGHLEPQIVDFGIAKLLEPQAEAITMNESFVGTPAYMSPEQGRGREVDARADQFAAAGVLYHAVTGKKLYSGTSFFEVLHAVTQCEYTPPRQVRPGLSVHFEKVLLRALSLDRTKRYPTVRAFGRALLSFASPVIRRRWAHRFGMDETPLEPNEVNPLAVTAPLKLSAEEQRRLAKAGGENVDELEPTHPSSSNAKGSKDPPLSVHKPGQGSIHKARPALPPTSADAAKGSRGALGTTLPMVEPGAQPDAAIKPATPGPSASGPPAPGTDLAEKRSDGGSNTWMIVGALVALGVIITIIMIARG